MVAALTGFAIVLGLSLLGMPLAFATLFVGIVGFALYRGMEASITVSGLWIMEMEQRD